MSGGTLSGDTLCFSPDGLGVYEFEVVGSDSCGHADTCHATITLVGNESPSLASADDFSAEFCLPDFVCFPVSAVDPDGNIVEITADYGSYDSQLEHICFYADSAGVYTIVITATDDCGLACPIPRLSR